VQKANAGAGGRKFAEKSWRTDIGCQGAGSGKQAKQTERNTRPGAIVMNCEKQKMSFESSSIPATTKIDPSGQ
jgi:hypothetical protein